MTVKVELLKLECNSMVWVQVRQPPADVGTPGRDRLQLQLRMAFDQPSAECAGVPGRAEYRDAIRPGPPPPVPWSAPARSAGGGRRPPRRSASGPEHGSAAVAPA